MLRTRERPPTKADQERMVHGALAHGLWRGAEEIFVSPHAGVPPHPAMAWLAGLGWTGPPPANLRWRWALHRPQGDSPPGVVAALRDRLGFMQGVARVWIGDKTLPPLVLGRVNRMRVPLRMGAAPGSGHEDKPLVVVPIEAAIAAAAARPGILVWAAVTERNRDLLLDELSVEGPNNGEQNQDER